MRPRDEKAVCPECGKVFRNGGRYLRCARCRVGFRGVKGGGRNKWTTCELCGGKKSNSGRTCMKCWMVTKELVRQQIKRRVASSRAQARREGAATE